MRAPRSRKYIKAINQAVTLTETGEEMKTAVESLPVTNKLLGILAECGLPGCIIHARSYVYCAGFSTLASAAKVTNPKSELADLRLLAYSPKRDTARLLFLQLIYAL